MVFGWLPKNVDEGAVVETSCARCGASRAWHLHTVTMWISLFFVRVLPTGVEHWLRCADCGDGLGLSADQNALIRQGNDADDPTIVSWIDKHQGRPAPASLQ